MPNFLVENNAYQGTATPTTPIISDPIYEARGIFSINASNELQGTFWIIKNGQAVTSSLGAAQFTIYDQDGVTIGITESGLIADANGQYHSTPVLASAIQDLTHYVVKVGISLDGALRENYIGITLGE